MSAPEIPPIWTLAGRLWEHPFVLSGPHLMPSERKRVVEKTPVDAERERLLKENEDLTAWASVGRSGACVHSVTTGDCAGCANRNLRRERERMLDLFEPAEEERDEARKLLTEIGCGKQSLPGALRQIERYLDKALFDKNNVMSMPSRKSLEKRAEAAERRVRELETELANVQDLAATVKGILLGERDPENPGSLAFQVHDTGAKLATAVRALRAAEHVIATVAGRLRLNGPVNEGDVLAEALPKVRQALSEIQGGEGS